MPFKVRHLDILPCEGGFLIKDPLGISKDVFFNKESLLLLFLINEEDSIDNVKIKFLRKTGMILSDSEILGFLRKLDRNYMLYNENFLNRVRIEKEKIRSLSFKEIVYNLEENLKEEIISAEERKVNGIKGILVPHIDLNIGKEVYVKSYAIFKNLSKKIFFIFGVPHFYSECPFSVFPKNYKIKGKIIKVENRVIENLKKKFEFDIFSDFLAYKNEHSVEFPILFLNLVKEDFSIIPSLVSEAELDSLREMADKIFDAIEEFKEDIFFISSVDLSHVGKKFGDLSSFDPRDIDLKYLEYLKNLENEEAFKFVKGKDNFTRIDGLYTNFVFIQILKLIGCKEGEIVDYRIYHEEFTDSIVSFASMIFK